jgi:hypothetical protein
MQRQRSAEAYIVLAAAKEVKRQRGRFRWVSWAWFRRSPATVSAA